MGADLVHRRTAMPQKDQLFHKCLLLMRLGSKKINCHDSIIIAKSQVKCLQLFQPADSVSHWKFSNLRRKRRRPARTFARVPPNALAGEYGCLSPQNCLEIRTCPGEKQIEDQSKAQFFGCYDVTCNIREPHNYFCGISPILECSWTHVVIIQGVAIGQLTERRNSVRITHESLGSG